MKNAYELAGLAECSSPNEVTSPGAEWLELIQTSVEEWYADDDEDGRDIEDAVFEMADSLVPIYTHQRWEVFTDLAAYQEEVLDSLLYDDEQVDMTKLAGVALYQLAERLIWALVAEKVGV